MNVRMGFGSSCDLDVCCASSYLHVERLFEEFNRVNVAISRADNW